MHQLNGVVERSIRSVSELARSYLVAGNVPTKFWPMAFDMAVDVLNRTSGPEEKITSCEMLTGSKPRVMNIMPFGCRAFAVKPREQYSKTDIDPRAWVGVNMGRSLSTPGAYRIYVPDTGRVLLTSEVYFWENYFPLRPRNASGSTKRPPARPSLLMTTAHSRRACRHRPAHRRRRTHWPHWSQLRFPRRTTHRAARSCSFPAAARTRAL